MLNIALAACILLFAAAGYIAFMNSKLIADKNGSIHSSACFGIYRLYDASVHGGGQRSMIPIGVMEFRDPQGMMKVYLCRVRNASEDLKLEQAGNVFLHHLTKARDTGSLMFYRTVDEALQGPEEKSLTDRLSAAQKAENRIGKQGQSTH